MKRGHVKLVTLLAAVLLVLGMTGGALASDHETSIVLEQGQNEFTYTVEFDPIGAPYASAQFDITISNKNELQATKITFKDDIIRKAGDQGGIVNTINSGGREDGNQVIYQAGFFSTKNQYGNEGSICTITLKYTGSTPQTVKLDKLELWRLTGKVTNGIPELEKETLDWSRTIRISRATVTPGGGTGPGGTKDKSPVTSETRGNITTVSTAATGVTDSATGKTAGRVDSAAAAELVNSAKNAETEGRKAVVEIKLETTGQTGSAELTIPRSAFDRLAGETDAHVKVVTGIATISFDPKAVESISSVQGTQDIKVIMEKVDKSTLTPAQQETVGDRPVYDFSVIAGGQVISSLGDGRANISIPYTLKAGEDKNAIVVYFIDASGHLQEMRGAYQEATGTVVFTVTHFSKYFIGYHKVSFHDVAADAWYSDAVTFIAARGITTGTEPGKFSPNAAITRGQYIVMLMKAYGIAPEENPQDNFADAGNTYYTGYLAAAKRLQITQGAGDNKYYPGREISRQDMFTLLYRSLDLLGELPERDSGGLLSAFSDGAEVADYAREAMEALVKGGIITGHNGKLDPKGRSTRAQMAQVLYNLLSDNVATPMMGVERVE